MDCLVRIKRDQLYRLVPIFIEDDFPKETARRIIHVYDYMLETGRSLKSPFDQIRSSRSKHLSHRISSSLFSPKSHNPTNLDPDIVRHLSSIQEFSTETEVRIRSSWVRDLDLLESNLNKVSEKAHLLLICHGCTPLKVSQNDPALNDRGNYDWQDFDCHLSGRWKAIWAVSCIVDLAMFDWEREGV